MANKTLHKSDDSHLICKETLNDLMKKNHTTSKDLQKYLGVTKSAISNYVSFNNDKTPCTNILKKLALYFDVPIGLFFGEEQSVVLNETDTVHRTPFFNKTLDDLTEGIVYKSSNFLCDIKLPTAPCGLRDCCAVMIYDGEQIKSAGINVGDYVYFEKYSEVESGQIAAVHFKEKNKVSICRVIYDGNKTILEYGNKKETYSKKEMNDSVIILGKAIKSMSFKNLND